MQNKTGPRNMICLDKILLWRKHPGKHQTHTVPTAKIANQHPEQQVILSLFASGQGCSFKRGFTLQPHSRKITFHFNISFLSKNAVRQQVNIYKKKKKDSLYGCVNTLSSSSLLKIHWGPGDLSRVILKGNVFKVQTCLIQ